MHTHTFNSMGLKPRLLQTIATKGFEKPTPIQILSIPSALAGRDVMGQAQTGTGKTAAFGIPMLNNMVPGGGLQGLVVCPTRELAVQVAGEINSLGRGMNLKAMAVYGGQSMELQIRALSRKPEMIVGTPGRLMDHMERGNINLAQLSFVVLDEADEMLDMGFLPDIEKILEQCPKERQTFLFSATLDEDIQILGRKFMVDPELIVVESPELTVPLTEQYYYEVSPRHKIETICRIIDVDRPSVSLIFCRTKKGVDQLAGALNHRGYAADALHGDMSQRERDSVMERFRKGHISILVATDLAARGLDIDMVTHVFNFDIPEDPDSYVHRIGRTGRAGRDGVAITMVEPRQIKQLRVIEHHIGKKICRRSLPSLKDAMASRQRLLTTRLMEASHGDLSIYQSIAGELIQQNDPHTMLAAALKLLADGEPALELAEVEIINADTAHVELPVGKMQGMHPRRLVEFLTANTSLTPRQVGDIEIQSNTTYVEVPVTKIDEVYEAFKKYESKRKNNRSRLGLPKTDRNKRAN
ncbi:RNA helicase, DEAD-box type, Q motif [Syntrophomonas zehnderi OL-4]|uniref:RNA helicase n=1 Tax=Syntrophomonas zehnderi OL-4 TaxID=690567 RepID=A0A0E4C856_9FIRM|nr:DEAD/DEAH box helicase [Syntrophomonas zehnderi]CFX26696.1 RNA helicase, DEAD-box type, Q motif [Syntrophomonas zehnderi OL-4]